MRGIVLLNRLYYFCISVLHIEKNMLICIIGGVCKNEYT